MTSIIMMDGLLRDLLSDFKLFHFKGLSFNDLSRRSYSFSVLMFLFYFQQPPDEIDILKILTYVGLTLSLLGAVITIICYLLLT